MLDTGVPALEPPNMAVRRSSILRLALVVSLVANGVLAWRLFERPAHVPPPVARERAAVVEPAATGDHVDRDAHQRPTARYEFDAETGFPSVGEIIAPDGRTTGRWFDRDHDGRYEYGEGFCGRDVQQCYDRDQDGCCERVVGVIDGKEKWSTEDRDGDGMMDFGRDARGEYRDSDKDGFLDCR